MNRFRTRRSFLERLDERSVLSALAGGPNPNELVDINVTATELAQSLVGPGVSVSNVNFKGNAGSSGAFTFNDPTVIGFWQGIVLSSGSAADVVGPNMSDSTSTAYGGDGFGGPGDADLSALAGYPTYDAAVLEFDFTPMANQVVFTYAFASDEYPEWVNTPFNDVFAFYVNGTNYATVRQTAGDPTSPFVPVAVNNINNSNPVQDPPPTPMRPDLFRANYYNPSGPSAIDLEQDGITHVLTFQAPVIPGITNHMKLAIADASDGVWDSAVFIQAGSLVSNENPVADLSLSQERGPAPLPVTAIVEGEDPNGLPLTYSIDWGDGTTSSGLLDSPNNDSEKTTTVDHTYAAQGHYQVVLTVSNGSLSSTSSEDVEVTSPVGDFAPAVTLHPVAQTVADGGLFSFTTAAIGSPLPLVQWQVSSDNGATFADIPGATAATFTATASLAESGNLYRAVFTNSEGMATTAAALLTVAADESAPVVTSAPTDQIAVQGEAFTFSADATGVPTPTVQWQVSYDSGLTFEDIAGATDTTYTSVASLAYNGALYQAVFSNDQGSAVTQAASLTVIPLDIIAPNAPLVSLANDTGSSATDKITSAGLLTISGIEEGAAVGYSPDEGNTWLAEFAAAEGPNTVLVRQTDWAGNVSDATTFTFTLDTITPIMVDASLAHDTGAVGDNVSSDGTVMLANVEPDASVEYSVDGGLTWSGDYSGAEGANVVEIRQVDLAGNIGDNAALSFTLDTLAPAAPGAALTSDTGSSTADGITSVGTLTITGTETGASVEYSVDNGASWNGSFSAQEGANTVSVRQIDLAGNISPVTLVSVTLDTTPPQLNPTLSTTQPILVGAKNITVSPNATDAYGIASQSAGSVDTSAAGKKSLLCWATDLAGNSASVSVPYIVGYAASNVMPQAGATFKSTSTVPVSFQLSDANGLLSDQAASSLAGKITVTFDGKTVGTAKYHRRSNTFSLNLKIGKQAPGAHTLAIQVTVNGDEVTTVVIPVNIV